MYMPSLRVQIVRFVDAYQPGIVECQFRDAEDKLHSIICKQPYLTTADLWWDSEYPQSGEMSCLVHGLPVRGAVRVTLSEETADGRSEFKVSETDLIL